MTIYKPIDKLIAKTCFWLLPKWITPNRLTILRFVLTPVVVWLLAYNYLVSGFVLFVIAALSDAVDGAMARTKNMITEWGKLYDPLADRILVGSVTLVVLPQVVGGLLVTIMFAIELVALAIFFKKFFADIRSGIQKIGPSVYGKIKMILYCFGLASALVSLFSSNLFFVYFAKLNIYLGIIFSVISFAVYCRAQFRMRRGKDTN